MFKLVMPYILILDSLYPRLFFFSCEWVISKSESISLMSKVCLLDCETVLNEVLYIFLFHLLHGRLFHRLIFAYPWTIFSLPP